MLRDANNDGDEILWLFLPLGKGHFKFQLQLYSYDTLVIRSTLKIGLLK